MKRALLISLALWTVLFGVIALLRWGGPEIGRPDLPQDPGGPARITLQGQAPWLGSAAEEVARRASPVSATIADTPPGAEGTLPDQEAPEEPMIEEEIAADGELLERAGLPRDTPLSLGIGRSGPPDPMERGRAELHVTLHDQATGEAVGSEVVLWRLSAPANVYWTAGDQDVARARISPEGHTFSKLVAGEYRLVVLDERAAAPHHPPFHVSGATAHELFVQTPRERPARLVIDGLGSDSQVVEARLHRMLEHPRGLVPPWVAWRHIQPDFEDVIEDFEMTEGDPDFWELTWSVLAPGPTEFDLGSLREDTRRSRVSRRVEVRVGGEERGEVVVRNPASEPHPPLGLLTVTLALE